MRIVAHRGFWREPGERNGAAAFARAWDGGFGVETDVRDCAGRAAIAHDPPGAGAAPMPLADFLALRAARRGGGPLALNIKADGLQRLVGAALEAASGLAGAEAYAACEAYVFDMSVPDALGWLAVAAPLYVRHSEIEPAPALYAQAAGVWVDQFFQDWVDAAAIERHLDAGKAVCLVSPELHRRDHRPQWDRLAAAGLGGRPGFSLCTDFPDEAAAIFMGGGDAG